MRAKKSNLFFKVLDVLKTYWFIVPIAVGVITFIATLPTRIAATEKKVETMEQRTQRIEGYIQAIEEQKKLIKAAPEGWLWSEKEEKFIPDPHYKKGK